MGRAKNCIISCIDYRIQDSFFKWLKKTHKLGGSDIIELAGSSRDLVKPLKPADKKELLRNIELSVKLHDPDKIIVLDHQDCGGYAQDNTIQSGLKVKEDLVHHTKYLHTAVEILRQKYPTKEVQALYITLRGSVKKVL